jgi:hypothetical protein
VTGDPPRELRPGRTAPIRTRVLRTASVVLVLLSLAFLVHRVAGDWERLEPERLSLAIGPLAAHLGLLALSFLFLIAGWHLLLRAFGPHLPFRAAARSWLLGGIARYIPGKLASLVGRVVVCVREGGNTGAATAALVTEQVLYGIIGLAFLLAAGPRLVPASIVSVDPRLLLAGALVAAVLLVHPALIRRLTGAASRLAGRDDLPSNPGYGRLATVGSILAAGWILHGLAGFALVRAVTPLGAEHAPDAVLAFVGSWAAGFLAFLVPAGLGVREAALTLLLTPSIPGPLAVAVALLARLTWVVVELAGIAVVSLWSAGATAPGGATSGTGSDES